MTFWEEEKSLTKNSFSSDSKSAMKISTPTKSVHVKWKDEVNFVQHSVINLD